jgi:1,4-dihydroxy-2-naphthoate octaprenyltransferase
LLPWFLFGHALALREGASTLLHGVGAMVLASVLLHGAILWTNEWADFEDDAHNLAPTFLSGGAQTARRGLLSRKSVGWAAVGANSAVVGFGAAVGHVSGRASILLLALAAVLLSTLYSVPPVALSKRGGGEWLQALGMGLVLPALGFELTRTAPVRFDVGACFPAVLWAAGLHVATALPDGSADAAVGKRTVVVRLGEPAAKACCSALLVAGAAFAARTVWPEALWTCVAAAGLVGTLLVVTVRWAKPMVERRLHPACGSSVAFAMAHGVVGGASIFCYAALVAL